MSETRKVRYFFVGVGKCGTSWIYEFLHRHRPVATPSIKEPYLIDAAPADRAALVAKLYDPAPGQEMADFSNVYYWDPENAAKIHDYNPDARIVVTTRLPSDRIVSHFGFMRRNDMIPQDRLADYIDEGDALSIVARSYYREILDRYVTAFGRENVLVLPMEQLGTDPQTYADRLADFMGVERIVLDEGDKAPVLKAVAPRSRLLARTASKAADAMRALGLLSVLGSLKRASVIRKVLFKPAAAPTDVSFGKAEAEIAALDADYPALLRDYGAA